MKFAVAVMWRPGMRERAEALLLENFGAIEDSSGPFAFPHESYYAPEMGKGLEKAFYSFEGFVPRNFLVMAKHRCAALEEEHLDPSGNRELNLDPMLVSVENVVIATSKNFPHRVYLTQGVYADLALVRKKGGFEKLPWTYDDYAANLDFFERVSKKAKGNP